MYDPRPGGAPPVQRVGDVDESETELTRAGREGDGDSAGQGPRAMRHPELNRSAVCRAIERARARYCAAAPGSAVVPTVGSFFAWT